MRKDPDGHGDPAPGAIRRRDSLRTRMALWSAALNAALVLATALAFYLGARMLILRNAGIETRALATQTAHNLESILDSVQVSGRTLAASATGVGGQAPSLRPLLLASLAGDPDIAGAMIIVQPGKLPGNDAGYTWYVRRDRGRYVEQSVEALGYDYATMPWYVRTMASARPWWSEPYANAATAGDWFTTYNLPLRRAGDGPDAPAIGMVSLDVPVSRLLRGILDGVPGGNGVEPMLFSPEGLAVAYPRSDVRMRRRLREVVDGQGRADLAPLAHALAAHRPVDFEHRDAATREAFLTLGVPVGDSGWTFATSVSERYMLRQLNRIALWVALAGALALALTLWLAWRYTGRILGPIGDLTNSAGHFAQGEFDYPLPHAGRGDEVGVMARAFDVARGSIKRQMAEIERMAGARQKIDSELAIAREIQLSMAPPPRCIVRAGAVGLDIHAALEPAKAVGGDFYGFHESGDAVWFGIGDVSDKGMPAALFMARCDTVLQTATRSAATPAEALAIASRGLVERNDACMFVTVLAGRIDLGSGECMLASAGHEAPLLLRADGRVERLDFGSGPPLGFEACDEFPSWRGRLDPGDSLVAWTDGVNEAFDAGNEAFGDERLIEALAPGYSARENCERLIAAVHAFAGGAPQSDDITVMALRLQGGAERGSPTC